MAVLGSTISATSPVHEEEKQNQNQYCSRKPKWWTQLSGRRGTRGQRQAIQRMTHRGYCLSKDLLTDFSRVNNRARQDHAEIAHENGKGGVKRSAVPASVCECNYHQWRIDWWNRALGVATDVTDAESARVTNAVIESTPQNMANGNSEKYSHKIQQMYKYKNPLPPNQYDQVWLEIGFGNGDNMLANAINHPGDLFLGCEIHQPGVGTLLRQMEMAMGLLNDLTDCQRSDRHEISDGEMMGACETMNDQSTRQQSKRSSSCQNIRVLPGDGIKLLSHLPTSYLDVILITFPDPWPRDCHIHWRVIQREVVCEMHRVLKPSGKVFVATDDECFDEWTREIFRLESYSNLVDGEGGDGTTVTLWNELTPCPDRTSWLPVVSYYEQKGLDMGRCIMLQCWQRL